MFLREYCGMFKNSYFEKHLRTTVSASDQLIAYKNKEWCHSAVCVRSPPLISFYCVCCFFRFLYFFLVFCFFSQSTEVNLSEFLIKRRKLFTGYCFQEWFVSALFSNECDLVICYLLLSPRISCCRVSRWN